MALKKQNLYEPWLFSYSDIELANRSLWMFSGGGVFLQNLNCYVNFLNYITNISLLLWKVNMFAYKHVHKALLGLCLYFAPDTADSIC